MATICDTHVHIYPCYDTRELVRTLAGRLAQWAPAATRSAVITEGVGSHVFEAWRADPDALRPGGVTATASDDGGCLRLAVGDDPSPLWLFPGRQVVTAERVEILSLVSRVRIPDGRSAIDTVQAVLDADGIPVVSWAPGKWFPPRERVVRALLTTFSPDALLLGDTSLRATGWRTPRLMAAAQRRGYRVIAGSDPLPFAGDERHAGCYATVFDADLTAETPVAAMQRMLRDGASAPATVGRRSGCLGMLRRLWQNARAPNAA